MRRQSVSVAAFLFALFILVLPDASHAQTLQKIRVTIPVAVFNFYPLYFAQENGYFAKEGLDVETIATNGDGPDVDALISGSVEFTVSTPNRLFSSYEQGKSLLNVMAFTNRMSIDCFMNKALADKFNLTGDSPFEEKLKALKDQTVAGTRPGAFTYLVLQAYAKRAGLTPQKDIKIIGIGGPNAMLPAVENGQIAVACIASPTIEIAVERGKSIEFTKNLAGKDPAYNDFMFQHVYARPEYVKENPETVRKFIRGLLGAMKYLANTPVETYLPGLKKRFTGLSDPMLIDIYNRTRETYKTDGFTTEAAYKKAADFLIDTGAISKVAPFKDLVTNDYLPAR